MLTLICAIVAVVLWALAVLPTALPVDRLQLIAAGLVAAWIPVLVHAAQTR